MCISGAPLSAHSSLLKYLPGYWRYDFGMPYLTPLDYCNKVVLLVLPELLHINVCD